MKQFILGLFILASSMIAKSQFYNSTYVNGYYRPSTNTYVNGYNRTQSNSTNWDNYSTQGNTNPYTNFSGSRARDYSTESYNYGSGQTIYEGPRGGQYYINSNGNKTYVPKRSNVYGY
jgi:hypothetical protein